MGRIVLGVGVSHSPLLTLDAEAWAQRAEDDRRNPALNLSDGRLVSYAELRAEVGEPYVREASLESLDRQAKESQRALDALADEIERAAPDVAIIIGDDHEELFPRGDMPAVAIFYGDELVMHPMLAAVDSPPPWLETAVRGCAMDEAYRFAAAPAFAVELIARLVDRGVDVSGVSGIPDPAKAGVGHAFGFVIQRLFRGRTIPVVPIFLNTYYPPNIPRPARCFEIGQKVREAVADIPGDHRIAIFSSGGLSHFVTDEALDHRVLAALGSKDAEELRTLPMTALKAGSSEILCWVMAAGALEPLPIAWIQYLPVYRTAAGTGIGLAFVAWHDAG